ncbi:PREDICTED: protein virilizer [Ceratosolen solmsi marchali]|uniref:Protein virilizer n=1 Tax=Ceratosolen solmsi marchali TaxID=326594 RepID=A0AAJ6YJD4_9HYME|nr:PREDICTED: protein virilizer [Ceratosolen solmsi marchali]
MDNTELLFFDTFSHDISEELNLDLVQFPKPVYISEVRIIPLGARVQADFPGGVRLGATNPSQFEIEFFVNDLSKPGASTFESLGGLEYKQNVHIQLECDRKHLPTDGLVLRGWYTTITLAVYGTLTKSLSNPQEIPGSAAAPPAAVNIPEEEVPVNNVQVPEQEQDWYYENQSHANTLQESCPIAAPSPPVHVAPVSEPPRTPLAESTKPEVAPWKEKTSPVTHKTGKRPSTPPTESLVSLSPESISAEEEDGEREEVEEPGAIEPFEPILSDEDVMADDEPSAIDYECEAIQMDELYAFAPPELLQLEKKEEFFKDKLQERLDEKLRDLIVPLSKSVMNFTNASGQEKETFVHNSENLCATLDNVELNAKDVKNLSNIIDTGLNVELACSQPQPAYKVRHVKVGVRLAEALCRLSVGPDILLQVNAPKRLLTLCTRENVALPVKLAAIRAVDAALISPKIVEEFSKVDSELYKITLMMLESAKLARLKYALCSLLRKVHVYELLAEPKDLSELEILELTKAYACATTLMCQPKRQLPASAQMEFEREQNRNPRKHLIAYFEHWKLASRLLLLLCSPNSNSNLIKASRELISLIANTKEGLLYLLKEAQVTRSLLKVLQYKKDGIGCTIAWSLQVVQCLIAMVHQPDDWAWLRKLHSFLIFPDGIQAIIRVVPMDKFIDILIPCLSNNDLAEFAAEIIATVVCYSSEVEIFQNRAVHLLEKCASHSVLRDVVPHLNVAAQISNWNYGDVTSLVSIVRKNAFPGELTTACRILHYLVFPSNDDIDPMEPYIELKHRNALTQLFAADGLTALVGVLTNIAQSFEQSLLYYVTLSDRRRLALFTLLVPCTRLTRAILERLVKCMATDFKDSTAIVPLLGVYCLIEAMPPTSSTSMLSNEIVETLLVFTRAVDSDSSGNVAKSLWTQMLGEVLKMVSSNPCFFVSGVKLLAKLLPPILTSKETSSKDKIRVLGFRKLWSAHLQAQASSLTETLRLMCASWNSELLIFVSTVCKQLSDLAAPTALLVGRCLLDGILTANPLDNNLPILALLRNLTRHAPMKATLLTLTNPASRAQVKSDQKYPPVIEMMCTTLRNTKIADAQRELIDIFETLCDYKLSFVQESGEPLEKQLAHSVPSKEPLLVIIAALIEILAGASKYPVDIVETTLYIIMSLTSHNYGLYHVKSCLENNPDALRSLLDYIAEAVSEKKEQGKGDSLSELVVNFINSLTCCEAPGRTLFLRIPQISIVLSWEKEGHPIMKIPQAAELVEALLAAEDKEDKEPIPEMLEPLLLPPEALLNQFAQRSTAAVPNEKEKVNKSLLEVQNDNTVDLLALATELLPADFNLLAEAQRVCSKTPFHYTSHSKGQDESQDSRETQKQINAPTTKTKQPFVTPMRGRSQYSNSMRGNSVGGGVGRGADPFRSRPPNTSRPPSLHVDDFVALETCGAQPTGPTGYNKLSIRGSSQSRGVMSSSRSRPWVSETRPSYMR